MKYKLGDICFINKRSYSTKDGYKFVNYLDTGNITKNSISQIQYIDLSSNKLPSRAKRIVQHSDIIYSTVRPNQEHYGFIKDIPDNFLVSTGFTVLTPNQERVDPYWLYCYLTQKTITDQMQMIAEQNVSTYPSIRPENLAEIELELPDLETQKKIVKILSALDQKIELNNSNNRVLYSLAESIFKERFKDKKYGDKIVGDYITPKRGKALLSKDTIEGPVPVVAGGLEAAAHHNKSNTSAPVITISASGANAGFVRLWGEKVWSSDSSFIDDSITKNVYFWYVLLKSRQKEIYDAQTGSAQAHIYPKHIADMPIGDISDEEISKYNNIVTPMFEKIALNDAANIELSATRDSLLPKLMSGEIIDR